MRKWTGQQAEVLSGLFAHATLHGTRFTLQEPAKMRAKNGAVDLLQSGLDNIKM
jgi:hypothetical protein